ncbi:MAG: hypothetical protein DRO14_04390, partial [Thermoprotei archaeon]
NFCFVSKRRKVVLNFPPLVLLAYFNMNISQNLRSYRNVLEGSREYLEKRIAIHNSIVETYPLSYVKTFFDEYNFYDRNIISKILYMTLEPIWERLVRLWIGYIEECNLLEEILSKSLSNPHNMRMLVPMSKIYEFYVFYKVAEAISRITNTKLDTGRVKTSRDLKSITIDLGNVRIYYNKSFEFYSLRGIVNRKYRPDIIIKSTNKAIIIDAKYKELKNIDSYDLHRLLSYVKDFESQGYTKVHGMLVVLDMSGGHKHGLRKSGQYSIIELKPNNDHYKSLYDHLKELLMS